MAKTDISRISSKRQIIRWNRVGGHSLFEWPTSHTTYPEF